MSWKDLMKTPAERERAAKLKRRRAISNAERLVDTIKDKVTELKTEKEKAWQEAVQQGKSGHKPSAQRSLKTIMSLEQQIGLLEMRRFTFEQISRNLDMANIDRDMQISLGDLTSVIHVDVAELEEALLGANDKMRDINDANKVFDKIARKQMDGIASQGESVSMTDLEKQLESAVAGSIGEDSQKAKISPETLNEIAKGRDELKNLLDKQK